MESTNNENINMNIIMNNDDNIITCIDKSDNVIMNNDDDILLIESLNDDFEVFNKSKKGRKSRQSIMVYQGKRNSIITPVKPIDVINEDNGEQQVTETETATEAETETETETIVEQEVILSLVDEELIQQLNNVIINDNSNDKIDNINDNNNDEIVSTPMTSSKKAKKTPKSSMKKKAESPMKTSPIKTSPITSMLTTTSLVLPNNKKTKNDNLLTKSLTLKSFSSPKESQKFGKGKVAKSTKSLTIPVTPKFKTDRRMGKKEISVVEKVETKTTFVDYGPKASTTNDVPKGPTIPQPFQFATDKRITTIVSSEGVPSVAELAEQFMKSARSNFVPKNACKQLTVGNAPRLNMDLRCKSQSRPKPLSKDEQDAKVTEDYNKIGFKARPIDKRIFQSSGELGVPKVAARPVTQTVAFSFNTDRRLGQHVKPVDMEATFKSTISRPSTSFVPKSTIPISPKLNVARGIRASSAPARRQKEKFEKPKETARYSSPQKLTNPKPFHLATQDRGSMYRASLEEQVIKLKIEEERQREIHVAAPPKFDHPFQPKHIEKKTKTQEFHLNSVARHQEAVAKFETDIMLEESHKKTEFHARPVPSTVLNPSFKIEKDENHVPIKPVDLTFESEKRAAKRKEFDITVAQQKKESQKKKNEDEKLKADLENQEINILRRKSIQEGGLIFKAQPIITKDLYPSKQTKSIPLTTPISPKFISKMSKKFDI